MERGSAELPEVVRTLAGVLHQFKGADLEAQLQTYDMFLGMLAPSVRPEVAALLRSAASRAEDLGVRDRILAAAGSVEVGGLAAEPYDHAKTMEAYTSAFQKDFPDSPKPEAGPKHGDILVKLDQIEAEMKRINFWAENPPNLMAAAERGELKSYLDAPSFELWLQAIFLPRARRAVQEDKLPSSQVGEMARRQYDYMSVVPEAEDLLRLLQEFDRLVINAAQ
jgi:uncharacterized protein YqcC (DUF446 family)